LILQTKDNNLIDGEEWILFVEKEGKKRKSSNSKNNKMEKW
jgi:hypothetical protein